MNSRYETIRILYESGMNNTKIAESLKISKQLVGYYLKQFPEYLTLKEERKKGGRTLDYYYKKKANKLKK